MESVCYLKIFGFMCGSRDGVQVEGIMLALDCGCFLFTEGIENRQARKEGRMISDSKASDMGVKFLSKHGHPKLARSLDEGRYCLDALFDQLLKSRGKRYVLHLYQALPRSLKEYVVCTLLSENEGLRVALHAIDVEFNRGTCYVEDFTKSRLKRFKRKCTRVIMQYLRGE